mgnify:CR=1 FL=1
MQQGDVQLQQTDDGGEIAIVDGVVTMSAGLETAAYLSLFGGNEDDAGNSGSPYRWWADLVETDPSKQYRSETQHLLQSIPAPSGNLRRVEDAARRDLQWLLAGSIASSVAVACSIPGVNRVKVAITIEAIGEESRFEFVENWKAATV